MNERGMRGPMDALPPKELWLHNPDRDGLLPTPLDERSLVDLDSLVHLAMSKVDASFEWTSSFNDIHHLQWFAHRYPHQIGSEEGVAMNVFRELVNRKAYVPRVFHNWVHRITEAPPVPSAEVMQYSIDAQRVAMSLSKTASLAVRLTRIKGIPERRLVSRLDQEFENYNVFLDNARLVPEEFSLLAISEFEVRSPDDILIINKKLGKLALDVIPMRNKTVLARAA